MKRDNPEMAQAIASRWRKESLERSTRRGARASAAPDGKPE
jgi:hypothetical protein